jgi:glycosyltransferase involved in cell wall biosynthesis
MVDDSKPNFDLTILMPCLNEAGTIQACIVKAQKFLLSSGIIGEILIADNGSTDGSQEIALSLGARVIDIPLKGYGSALWGGISNALGKYIIMGDADDSYDFSELSLFWDQLQKGSDLVMGNRFKGGIKPGAMPILHKYLGNPILSFLGQIFFHSPVHDFHCGLRGFKKETILDLNLQTTGMEFASEMVIKATLKKIQISEVPTILYPDGRSRSPHLRTWQDGWRHLRFLLMYSPNWLFLYPGMFLALLGICINIWLLPGQQKIGSITFDINTLLIGSFLILLGFQSITFSLFTRVFAINEGLLPHDDYIFRQIEKMSLEHGIMIGLLLVVAGACEIIFALLYWESLSFGPLNPSVSMRIAIPGTILLTVGIQTILSSFLISILSLKRKSA